MSISSHVENKTLHLQVIGALTVDIFKEFENAYTHKQLDHIVIDLLQCNHIDSGGLGMLLQMRDRMGQDASKITIKNMSQEIQKIFEVVRFEQLFNMA